MPSPDSPDPKDEKTNKDSILLSAKEAAQFLIVGIGASAGGIKPLREFFERIPADSGCAYVVILHLSPTFDSRLAEILGTRCAIPVEQVTEPVKVEPNHAYVIAPGMSMEMFDGMLNAKPVSTFEERRAPIDIFFRTLADTHDARAVAVILSGTGSDGSMGVKRVKERGGIIMVQQPEEAEYRDMPIATIETNLVDYVLPAAEMPRHVVQYRKHLASLKLPEVEEARDSGMSREEAEEAALHEVFVLLRAKTGHDFTGYKRATVLRRIARRMGVREIDLLEQYVAYLKGHPEEGEALLKDLLISVTNFFRDKAAFQLLEHDIIPTILKGKTGTDQVRVWVSACATGEEAYSMAMLFSEAISRMSEPPMLQIFATDIDDDAIATAREALYTNADVADVSPERLQRFFIQESADVFRVRRELRECVLFAHHNVLRDPPFSRLSLASCRNLLIYLMRSAQTRVLQTMHFALQSGGYLMLGSSESTDGTGDLYLTIDREQSIYQSRAVKNPPVPPVPDVPIAYRIAASTSAVAQPGNGTKGGEKLSLTSLHYQVLEQYAPPSVLVNAEYDIVHLSERAGGFLQIAGGEPSYNLLKAVRPELRMELRSALFSAVQDSTIVRTAPVAVQMERESAMVTLVVRPVADPTGTARGFVLVIFEKGEAPKDMVVNGGGSEDIAHHLEQELVNTRTQLRTATEQYEVQTEELRASNEELQAINEELRSAAEELETGKEELQSVNEELSTVNQELKVKIDELSHAHNDFQNLMAATDVGTIFLDRGFNVKLFTPAAQEIFNLLPGDFGRPLSDITHHLVDANLAEDAATVMQRLIPVEREVHTTRGAAFYMRVSPYRTEEDRIGGVVVTFINISRRVRVEEELRRSEERFRTMTNAIPQLVWTNEAGGVANYFNQRWYEYSGLTYEESFGLGWQVMVHPDDAAASVAKWQEALRVGDVFESELRLRRHDGVYRWHIGRNVPLRGSDGRTTAWFGSATDIEDLKGTEELLAKSEGRLRVTMESAIDYAIITTDTANIIEGWSAGAERIFGYKEAEAVGQPGAIIFTPEDIAAGAPEKEMMNAANEGRAIDERWHMRADGTRFYMSGVMRPIMNPELVGFVKVARDMTEQKIVEQQKDEFIGIASHELRTPVTSIKAYAEVLQDMFEESGDTEHAGLMKKMDAQIDRLAQLIRSLLDVTKLSEGKLQFAKETINLSELIADTRDELQRATKHELSFTPSAIPKVVGDPERIRQVLTNIISNAIKYSPETAPVHIYCRAAEGEVVVCVEDKGIGMTEEVAEQVFGRFYRSDEPGINTYPGLGLGLYISAEFVKRHGGRIWVEKSEPGVGSVFCFSLPVEGISH